MRQVKTQKWLQITYYDWRQALERRVSATDVTTQYPNEMKSHLANAHSSSVILFVTRHRQARVRATRRVQLPIRNIFYAMTLSAINRRQSVGSISYTLQ